MTISLITRLFDSESGLLIYYLQSVDMPLSRHFLKRQAWQPLRLSRPIAQFPAFWHVYGLWP